MQRNKKSCVVYLIIGLALLASFVIIFILSDVSAKALNKYPVPSDCSTLVGYDDDAKMQQGAILEYRTNTALEEDGKTVSYSKYYVQCFCDERATEGDATDAKYGNLDLPICEDYFDS